MIDISKRSLCLLPGDWTGDGQEDEGNRAAATSQARNGVAAWTRLGHQRGKSLLTASSLEMLLCGHSREPGKACPLGCRWPVPALFSKLSSPGCCCHRPQ